MSFKRQKQIIILEEIILLNKAEWTYVMMYFGNWPQVG